MLSSILFCLLLSVSLVSGHLLTDDRTTRRPRKGDPKERRKSQTRIQSRKQRSVGSQDDRVTKLKVFDFSADNDDEPDSNGDYHYIDYLGDLGTRLRKWMVWSINQNLARLQRKWPIKEGPERPVNQSIRKPSIVFIPVTGVLLFGYHTNRWSATKLSVTKLPIALLYRTLWKDANK